MPQRFLAHLATGSLLKSGLAKFPMIEHLQKLVLKVAVEKQTLKNIADHDVDGICKPTGLGHNYRTIFILEGLIDLMLEILFSNVLPKLLGSKSNQAKIGIINDISGIANVGRMTLLLGSLRKFLKGFRISIYLVTGEVLIEWIRTYFTIEKCTEKLIGLKAELQLCSLLSFFFMS
ncbi:hypothetical protein Patl1_24207 [Pistacia atlantica]|uniref:Uncharacterized protein n=1 Tax=Pistacia atlantica TaxID=434234 RepID=A0ACC0ZW38_9ROSI|nr:hypothetical protein Patl1_24207 [Pistacia atlantica]